MPAATSLKIRQEIVQRYQTGETFVSISHDLGVSYGTVRNIWRRYQQTGHLSPNYEACSQSGIRKNQAIYEHATALKAEHPTWGAGLIWVELADEFPEKDLPSERTLQRWFHRAELVEKKQRDQVRDRQVQRGCVVHEVWALDAKEQIQLADGSEVSWIAITDEGSGAMLEAGTFPPQEVESG